MDNIVPAVLESGAEIVKWPSNLGLPVTSQLLDSLMKFLRAGKSVRLWMNLDTPVPDHKISLSRNIASALMRRRSQQLLSRLRRFRNFSGFSAVWTCKSDSLMLQPNPAARNFGVSTFASAPNLGQCWTRFSGCADVSSTAPAPASTRRDSKCDGYQETANCLQSL